MTTRIFTMLVFVIAAAVPRAETVGEWLAGELDEAITGPYVDAELKSGLIAAARLHGQDFAMEELDECHRVLLDELVESTGRPLSSEAGWLRGYDPVGYLVNRLITVFHTVGFEREDIEIVDAQIHLLVDALVQSSAEQYPELFDEDTLDYVHTEWTERLLGIANQCNHPTLKFALPEEDFEELLQAFRTDGISGTFAATVMRTHVLRSEDQESKERWLSRVGMFAFSEVHQAYKPHADIRFGVWDRDALIDDLEAAGVEGEYSLRLLR